MTPSNNIGRCSTLCTCCVNGDEVFGRPECQELREEISLLTSQFGRKLRLQTGDRRYDGNVVGEGGVDGNPNRDELSIDFVKSIAEQEGEDDVDDLPLLQVYANDIAFETNAVRNRSSSIHFTNARLLDGSGDTILGRFSMNPAQDGHKLNGGDIIRLDRFTPSKQRFELDDSSNACSCDSQLYKHGVSLPPDSDQ